MKTHLRRRSPSGRRLPPSGYGGIFGEVFDARGVSSRLPDSREQELHHRGGDRDTTLFSILPSVRFCVGWSHDLYRTGGHNLSRTATLFHWRVVLQKRR
ncbi:hypothetical protein KCP73_08575 [Salmonella enterica subsp. enterica]|nr:hypothetical protein KCP73_08575 [Salmonella enterica subsp. enterica]